MVLGPVSRQTEARSGHTDQAHFPRRPHARPKLGPHDAERAQEVDIFAKIERLAELQQKGILSPEEFVAKKAELLSRL
jgi:hypothetical protein